MVRQRLRSALTTDFCSCYICKIRPATEIHHIFNKADKKNSERYRLIVPLCHACHNEPPDGVHHNELNNVRLKAEAQMAFEKEHSHESFMKIFGRDYIEYLKELENDSK